MWKILRHLAGVPGYYPPNSELLLFSSVFRVKYLSTPDKNWAYKYGDLYLLPRSIKGTKNSCGTLRGFSGGPCQSSQNDMKVAFSAILGPSLGVYKNLLQIDRHLKFVESVVYTMYITGKVELLWHFIWKVRYSMYNLIRKCHQVALLSVPHFRVSPWMCHSKTFGNIFIRLYRWEKNKKICGTNVEYFGTPVGGAFTYSS